MHMYVTVAIMLLIGIYVLAQKLFLAILFTFIPNADLPRANDGAFLVTLDNYDNWTTYARIWDSQSKTAYIEGQLIMRSIPFAEPTCDGIDYCDKYESEFYRSSYDRRPSYSTEVRVILINPADDLAITSYVESALNAIASHNKTVMANGFDFESSFQLPELEGLDYAEMSFETASDSVKLSKEDKERNEYSARLTKKALEMCRENGSGCEVEADIEYDWGVFSFTKMYIIEPK